MQRDALLLAEMVDAAERIIDLVVGADAATLMVDRDRRDALLWNFTVLGEAARAVSPKLRAAHTSIDWVRPTQLRNRIVHGYWSVDLDILIDTAEIDLPDYVVGLRAVLAKMVGSDAPDVGATSTH